MFKRFLSVLIVLALGIALTMLPACSDDEDGAAASVRGATTSGVGASGVMMRAKQGTAELQITRVQPGGTKPSNVEPNTWTVFVYLCGSDLESSDGDATEDLGEMVGASGSENVRFVVETGGAKKWANKNMHAKQLQRFLIQDGSIQEVASLDSANMGETNTLADFLTWGVKNYPADHMGVILWNHGGGSISGVCFDERNNDDSLVLRELDDALATAYQTMWDKFEFVGFDACLMGTLETANVLASYARYLYGSEEMESGTGWEYSSIMEHLAQNPTCTGAELGKVVCDAYLDSITYKEDRDIATFSVIDLSHTDELLRAFNRFSQELYEASEDAGTLATMVRAIGLIDNFGGNNRSEGYTNMVDLGSMVEACAEAAPSAGEVLDALHAAVVHHQEGPTHAKAQGLSVYYPLQIEDANELAVFEQVCVSPYYLSFVDRQAHAATSQDGTGYEDYDSDTWFDKTGWWEWLFSDGEAGESATSAQADGYWDYVDEHSGESTVITFDKEPQFDKDGIYGFKLSRDGLSNAASVSALVYQYSEDESDFLLLGETYDVEGSWKTGKFKDMFDGYWLSLPDGQNLSITLAETADDYVVYTAPIELNGKDTNLRIRQYLKDDSVEVEGAWDGIDQNGSSSRGITKIKKGDVIVPLYESYGVEDDAQGYYEGDAYKVGKTLTIDYDYLPEGTYDYSFCIYDVFGDCYQTDSVEFQIDKDGEISYFL